MSFVQLVAAAETSGSQSQAINPVAGWYFVIALVAAVVALVVMIFIHTSAHRSSSK